MKFKMINVPVKTGYALYLKNNPRRYCQNIITTSECELDIPEDLAGPGYLTLSIPRVDRLTYIKNYKVEFDLQADYVCDLAKLDDMYNEKEPATPSHDHNSESSIINHNSPSVVSKAPVKGKKLITNKLQERVQENNVKKLADVQLPDTADPKKNFWDRFK